MNQDLAIIKKKYGEKMMHLCRELFPIILEQPGLLSHILLSSFESSKFLYDDIATNKKEEDFKNYIYSFIDVEKKDESIINKTPRELLDEAGYILYECKTEEDIQAFKKYYSKGEELCTFNGGRLNRCYVFFAVKKNVEEIIRENFINPQRQDVYGTSVISIQFAKGEQNTLSIKNRYNHRVNNPDATFSNNLDNIIEGLTESFEREYNLNLGIKKYGFELPGYVKASDGKYYKYNYEINNIYYCPNNIIIDNFEVIDTYKEKEKYIISDYFIIDLINKKIELYDKKIKDCFVDEFSNISKIKVLNSKESSTKIIEIEKTENKKIIIVLDKNNKIIKYYNENITKVGDEFLVHNKGLTELSLPKLQEVGDKFLFRNKDLTELNLPKLQEAGDDFLYYNIELTKLNLPKLQEVGDDFLCLNEKLTELNLPNLKKTGNSFLYYNVELTKLNLLNLQEVRDYFLYWNKGLTKLSLPNLKKKGDAFIWENKQIVIDYKVSKIKKASNIISIKIKEIITNLKYNIKNKKETLEKGRGR